MEAAQIFLQLGLINNAAACFEQANDFLQAADLYLKTNSFANAANCLARTERKLEAAQFHIIAGQIAQAFELVSNTSSSYVNKAKSEDDFKKLIDSCLESRRTAAAAQLLELKKDFLGAAEKYKDCLMLAKAAECLEKSGKHRESAILYLESGDSQKAAESFKHARLFKEAAECFERAKNWSEAKKMYERCSDRDGIARCKQALNWF
jgi:tetratricopeptide (TPR) repeat protein